jgi:hypothetical protein
VIFVVKLSDCPGLHALTSVHITESAVMRWGGPLGLGASQQEKQQGKHCDILWHIVTQYNWQHKLYIKLYSCTSCTSCTSIQQVSNDTRLRHQIKQHMTWLTWLTWHDLTWFDMTWHDLTWLACLVTKHQCSKMDHRSNDSSLRPWQEGLLDVDARREELARWALWAWPKHPNISNPCRWLTW